MQKTLRILVAVLVAGVLFVPAAVAATRNVDQPHMNAALDALKQAQMHLKEAEHNKGGHRADAENLVVQAIKQVNLGIVAGEENAK